MECFFSQKRSNVKLAIHLFKNLRTTESFNDKYQLVVIINLLPSIFYSILGWQSKMNLSWL